MGRAGGTAFDMHGPADAPAVVLIHGLGLNRDVTWAGMVPDLAQRFRVITYDLPGHGQSARAGGAVDLPSLGAQVVALMDALGLARAALVGFSLGGMINRRVALDHPDRVSGLCILNSPHERAPGAQAALEARVAATGSSGPAVGIEATLARWFTPGFQAGNPAEVDAVRKIVLGNDPASYAAHLAVLVHGVTELIRPAPPIACPTLVMTGEGDTGSSPAMAKAIAAEIPGASCEIVPGLQHLGLLERPEIFAQSVAKHLGRLAA